MPTPSPGSLQMGSSGPMVSQLQVKLNAALMLTPRLVPDGAFGMKTSQAVKLFQQRKSLTADGIVGPKTAAVLGLSLGGPGGLPGPTPGGLPVPVSQPPGGAPPAFVDLSMFNVVVEEIIAGVRKIELRLLSWVDSDFVPQFIYDGVERALNNTLASLASSLRGITRQAVPLGQDPAAFVTSRIRDVLARGVSGLFNALQPLVGLPVIGGVAARYQRILAGVMSAADTALANLRSNGQSAQETARKIAQQLDSIARQIS